MRSFLLSLVLNVLLLCCSAQARHRNVYGHGEPRAQLRRISMFDAKHKRDENVPFTYFVDGRGACGATNGPNDFIVALNTAEFAGGALCFEMITITINGKTTQAQIVDECTGCSEGGLDFSQGLFKYFASLSEGVLYGSWSYGSGVATSSLTPTTTSTTPSWTSTAVTATSASPSSSTALSTTLTSFIASTGMPSPTSTTPIVSTFMPQNPQIIAQIELSLLGLGALLQTSLKLGN